MSELIYLIDHGEFEAIFEELDKDKNGKLSVEEFKEFANNHVTHYVKALSDDEKLRESAKLHLKNYVTALSDDELNQFLCKYGVTEECGIELVIFRELLTA